MNTYLLNLQVWEVRVVQEVPVWQIIWRSLNSDAVMHIALVVHQLHLACRTAPRVLDAVVLLRWKDPALDFAKWDADRVVDVRQRRGECVKANHVGPLHHDAKIPSPTIAIAELVPLVVRHAVARAEDNWLAFLDRASCDDAPADVVVNEAARVRGLDRRLRDRWERMRSVCARRVGSNAPYNPDIEAPVHVRRPFLRVRHRDVPFFCRLFLESKLLFCRLFLESVLYLF